MATSKTPGNAAHHSNGSSLLTEQGWIPKAVTISALFLLVGARFVWADGLTSEVVKAAMERTRHRVIYDGSYRAIDYPGGDVPGHIGVCTDVVIRAFRKAGIDLQKEVHEDMQTAFSEYPSHWGLKRPDANIDHRRVPNLQVYFKRHGQVLPVSSDARDYQPGDLVTWVIPGNLPHIGIVVTQRSPDAKRPMIVHNIGRGPQMEDMLFSFPITGHYRYP